MDHKITFGYWGARGGGQTTRLLLAYTGAVWEDVKYTSPEQWFQNDKTKLGLCFPNLPYIIEGDFKLTESYAIVRYVVNRSNKKELLGKTIQDQALVENIIGVWKDVAMTLWSLFYNPKWQDQLKGAVEKATPKLEFLSNYYGDKQWALGYLTIADFYLGEFSHYIEKIAPQEYVKYPFLARLRKGIDDLPQIKQYYESPTAVKGPFTGGSAAIQF